MRRVKNSNPKSYCYAESSLGCFDDDGIKGMLRITEAIGIKRAVEKELDWFASTYPRPLSVISHPATNSIKKFQNLIYGEKFDKQVDGLQMSPNEMANLCCDRWISSDHVHWLLDDLNISQKKLFVFTSITRWM